MLLLLIVCTSLVGSVWAHNPLAKTTIAQPRTSSADYLLPNNLTVSLYELILEPDFETDTFNGSIRVTITTRVTTNSIVLHTHEIEIDATTITLEAADSAIDYSVINTDYSNDDRHFYTITFANNLEAGNTYTIDIGAFTGILNLDNYGFYLARYVDENGEYRKMATTQFQATAARRAFPCFDEPALKAQFDISIIRDETRHSLANTPLVSTTLLSPGRYLDVFDRTVVMSTYLVAFIVSDFTYIEEGIQRVYGRPALIADGRGSYPLELGIDILDGITDFVKIPYTLDKLDQVAIPDNYFSAGAMENWGLITYREEFLLYATNITDSDTKEFIAIIIAHELGHQWFGNLVSPTWWSYLWLNEGFATYFEYYGGYMNNYNLELADQMVIKSTQRALGRDSTATTRHMNQDAGSPADVDALFDVVAYDKAGAVIRMAESILTRPVFQNGLTIFLEKMEFGAAEPEDLYSSWQEAADQSNLNTIPVGETVSSIFTTWDSNPGYPLLTVERDYITGYVTFGQRRFIETDVQNTDESLWTIPLSYTTASVMDFTTVAPRFWLKTRTGITTLTNLNAYDWLIVNVRQYGYYRVNYDLENWNRILIYLNSENFVNIDRLNRAQIIDDSFTLARHGALPYFIPLEISKYIQKETDYIAMYPFFVALQFLDIHLANSPGYLVFAYYIRQILSTSYAYVGLTESPNDEHLVKMNRENILTWVCRYQESSCISESLSALRLWKTSDDYLIPPTIQTPVLCAALRNGTQDDWNFVFSRYASDPEMVVRRRLLRSLGCALDYELLNNFVNIIITEADGFRSADKVAAFASIYNSGPVGLQFVHDLMTSGNPALISLSPSERLAVVNGVAARSTTMEQLTTIQDIAAADSDVNYSSAIATVNRNIQWSNQMLPDIFEWLYAL